MVAPRFILLCMLALAHAEDEEPSGDTEEVAEDYLKNLNHPGMFFRVDFKKDAGEKLGGALGPRNDYLEVEKISEAGALARWNAASPSRAIKLMDRIIAVNGVQGNVASMTEKLRSVENFSLRVFRVGKRDREALEQRKKDKEVKKVLKVPPPRSLGVGIPEPPGSLVANLHANNLDQFVAVQPYALVMFYANWCGHCKELAPELTEAARLVADMDLPHSVRLGKFDDGDEGNRHFAASSPQKFNYTSFPTFVWFSSGKHEKFGGATGAHEIAAHIGAKVKGLDPEEEIRKSLLRTRPLLYRPDTSPEVVLDLEPETFDSEILSNYAENNRIWIVEYYSDQCPICKSLKPEIIQAAGEITKALGGQVRVAGVNSRAFNELAVRFGVTSYPWIMSIYAGKKLDDMAGLGGAESVVNWAKKMHKQHWKKEPAWNADLAAAAGPSKGAGSLAEFPDTFNATGTWREILGRRTWFFLHTVAAKYPETPTAEDEAGVRFLFAGLAQHYPCPLCRLHLQKVLMEPSLGPVPTKSRSELVLWVCKLHNHISKGLGNAEHTCNALQLDIKYLKSCGECTVSQEIDEDLDTEEKASAKWNVLAYLKRIGGQDLAGASAGAGANSSPGPSGASVAALEAKVEAADKRANAAEAKAKAAEAKAKAAEERAAADARATTASKTSAEAQTASKGPKATASEADTPKKAREVSLTTAGGQKIGMRLVASNVGTNTGLMVDEVVRNGQADRTGLIFAKDVVTHVNGVDVQRMSLSEAKTLISSKDSFTFKLVGGGRKTRDEL